MNEPGLRGVEVVPIAKYTRDEAMRQSGVVDLERAVAALRCVHHFGLGIRDTGGSAQTAISGGRAGAREVSKGVQAAERRRSGGFKA